MAKCILEAKGLGKKYGSRWVVNNISIKVSTGEIIGLLGPNGAGKTTSFYMMVGLVKATRGKIYMAGQDVTRMPIHLRARQGLGYLPQEASIFRKLSVEDNIMAILETQKSLTKKQIDRNLNSLLDEFNIQHVRKTFGINLSGGERRRVEIARALAMNPKFILLDEPFAGVDPVSVVEIKDIIRHLKSKNIGVLITDHNVRETLDICERAYIMNVGNMLAFGTPQDLLHNEEVKKVYLGDNFRL